MSVAHAGNPKSWSVDQVASFLEDLELAPLVKGFRENAVNGCDLLSLSDEELKGVLGCTALQVKKIRKNLAAAEGAPAAVPGAEPHRSTDAAPGFPASYPAVVAAPQWHAAPHAPAPAASHAAHQAVAYTAPAAPPPAGYPAVHAAGPTAAYAAAPVYSAPTPAPGPAADPHAAADAARRAAAATAALNGYHTATRNLQEAATILQAVKGNLAAGQAISTVGMISGAIRGRRRGFGPGGGGGGLLASSRVSPVTTLLQSGKLSRANEDVKRACARIQAAVQAVPGGTIPTIQPALMRKGTTGLFVNLLVGGLASQAMMMNNFSSNKAEVDQMLLEVQQALAWVGPKTREAQAAAAAAGNTSHNMHALNQSMAATGIY